MQDFLIYREETFFKFGSQVEVTEGDVLYAVFISKELLFTDKITLPWIAFKEGGKEALEYQAKKLFGEDDLEVSYKVVGKSEDKVELLLFAIKKEILEDIIHKAESLGLAISGVTLIPVYLSDSSMIDNGNIWIDWGNGFEVGVFSEGDLKDIFFIYKEEVEELSYFKKLYSSHYTFNPFKDTLPLPKKGLLLFKFDTKVRKKGLDFFKIFTFFLLFTVFSIGYYTVSQRERLNSLIREEKVFLEKVKKLEKRIDSLEKEKKQLLFFKKALSGISPLQIIEKIATNVPKGTELWNISVNGDSVEVEGFTPSVPDLLEKLNALGFVKDLKLIYSRPGKGYLNGKGEIFRVRFRYGV